MEIRGHGEFASESKAALRALELTYERLQAMLNGRVRPEVAKLGEFKTQRHFRYILIVASSAIVLALTSFAANMTSFDFLFAPSCPPSSPTPSTR